MARKKAEQLEVINNIQELTDAEKRKRLDLVMANLSKKNNNMVIGKLSDPKIQEQIDIKFIPTPSVNLMQQLVAGSQSGKLRLLQA